MTRPIRVLVVDDSQVVRALIKQAIAADPELTLAGEGSDGAGLVPLVHQCQPDVVLLDVHMPQEDGLSALTQLRKSWPSLPVVMFSALTGSGAGATIDALARGATDYVAKPSGSSAAEARAQVETEVLPRLRRAARRAVALPPPKTDAAAVTRRPPGRVSLVVIGTSTGGPNALATVLAALPRTLPVPVMIVQHMPASFTPLLAERLDKVCPLDVYEARDGMRLAPGQVYLAPGDRHMALANASTVKVFDGAPVNSCRPAADVLFTSAAKEVGAGVMAVLLTGMGSDGTAGARDIVNAGGALLAQDQDSCVVWGMPGSAVRAGLAYRVLPLDQVAGEIGHRAGGGR